MLKKWVFAKLEPVQDQALVIVRDPLGLTVNLSTDLHNWSLENGFVSFACNTNLLFRYKYEFIRAHEDVKKLLILDQTPLSRRQQAGTQSRQSRATPPFYPDVLALASPQARIDLDLRQYLIEETNDPLWPHETNQPKYAQLIARHLPAVLKAYENLRVADRSRFTDSDFETIVGYAALGAPQAAFTKPSAQTYWEIGLLAHNQLEALDAIAPDLSRRIHDELRKAAPPFCWFADANADTDTVIRAFYTSLVLAQHTNYWKLLLANVDPGYKAYSEIDPAVLDYAGPELVRSDPAQAEQDIQSMERELSKEALTMILLDELKINEPGGFAGLIERERYSPLLRSLALCLALKDLLNTPVRPAAGAQVAAAGRATAHQRIAAVLFPEDTPALALAGKGARRQKGATARNPLPLPGISPAASLNLVDLRPSRAWANLRQAYGLARELLGLRKELDATYKTIKLAKPGEVTFQTFWQAWNDKHLNRLEYTLSALERLVDSPDLLLPRAEDELPSLFGNALSEIRLRIRDISRDAHTFLDALNGAFQDMIAAQYPGWAAGAATPAGAPDAPVLTAQFITRCLKPNWDPQTEKAALFIFDGMRYDIWDQLLRPMLTDRMELLRDYPAASILPPETQLTRKAISAGAFPLDFRSTDAEGALLKTALAREFNITGDVETLTPEGSGAGETVRYRAGNLDVYIFELCDRELHKIQVKKLPDGRETTTRPLAFVYEQAIKNIIDTEVMGIMRMLKPGTKVFITADHGFGRVGRNPLWLEPTDLNEMQDCSYLNCWLRVPAADVNAKTRANSIAFTPEQLRVPGIETRVNRATGVSYQKQFAAILFPKTGYAFSRGGSQFSPDAYSHGGISIQELLIPMVVLRVKPQDEGALSLGPIEGANDIVEGAELAARIHLRPARGASAAAGDDGERELRVEVDAGYDADDPERDVLPRQIHYVPAHGLDVTYRFKPDAGEATADERRSGVMQRTLTIAVSFHEGRRLVRKSQTFPFTVRLNNEKVVRRVPAALSSILGMMPKG